MTNEEAEKFLVSVPVRGVSCNPIPLPVTLAYTYVSVPVRGVSCNRSEMVK